MSLTRIQLLSVPVADQDRARDFYVGTLGFDLVADSPMGPAQRWVQVRPQGRPDIHHAGHLVRHHAARFA
jgi:catechol 2,3-dioxygenase-like lactoylglutathione lyase family enzyme